MGSGINERAMKKGMIANRLHNNVAQKYCNSYAGDVMYPCWRFTYHGTSNLIQGGYEK